MALKKSHIYPVLGALIVLLSAAYFFHIQNKADESSVEPFMAACVEPTLAGKDNVGDACRSVENIKLTYDIDIKARIESQRVRLSETAKRIASGELQDPLVYKDCIKRGECADVPLLPSDVDTTDAAKLTPAQLDISTAFWDLAEKNKMTAPVCHLIPECAAMVKLSVVDYGF